MYTYTMKCHVSVSDYTELVQMTSLRTTALSSISEGEYVNNGINV